MPSLIAPPTPDQQLLLDVVAEAFAIDEEWPVYDYLEGPFDRVDKDAAKTLGSFPRMGRWNYGAVWWVGIGQLPTPTLDGEVGLTVLGMAQTKALRPLVELVFDVIELMVEVRRTKPLSRRTPRELTITNDDVAEMLEGQRRLGIESWPRLAHKVMEREPILSSGGSVTPEGSWTKHVPREADAFRGVHTISEYVDVLEQLTGIPVAPVLPVARSPLDLVASLDYLDAIWRVAHKTHLFVYPSAERLAKLTLGANTREEFDARLSALGEVLRSANTAVRAASSTKLPQATKERPLAPFGAYLASTVEEDAEPRVDAALADLEHALALRDAAQHAEAGDRAVQALRAFAIGHPVLDVPTAWSVVTHRVIEALSALREELSAISD